MRLSCLAATLLASCLHAEMVFLDVNGPALGAGPDGSGNITTTWDSLAEIWNADSGGAGTATSAWMSGDVAAFSAGTGAVGTINVTVSGTQSLGGLTVNQGTVNLLGSGVLGFSSPARVLAIGSGLTTTISARVSGTGTAALTKAGEGTLVLNNAANDYTGPTLIQGGTLKIGTDDALPAATDLYFGTTDTANPVTNTGNLDLSSASVTVKTLSVFSDSATANMITIGSGESLQVNGNVTVGPNYYTTVATPVPVTRLTLSGDGEFLIAGAGNRILTVGGVTSTPAGAYGNRGNSATLDMSGLARFTAELGSGGLFRIGDTSTNSSVAISTVLLAKESVIKTGTLSTASQNVSATPSTILKLGSISTLIQANTITIGMGGARAFGSMDFQTSTGTLKIRGYNGGENDRAAMTVGYGVGSTSNSNVGGSVNLVGHSSDLKLSTLQIAGRTNTAGGGVKLSSFSFNIGTLDANSIQVGHRSGSGAGTSSGRVNGALNLGHVSDVTAGNVIIGQGGLTVSVNDASIFQATNDVVSTVTVAGKVNVSIGATGGTSVTLGNAVNVGYTATAILNLTGGTTTVAGDIIKGTGAGFATVSSTVTLEGGTLDMSGRAIGNAAQPINNLNFRSGTLMNVSGLNGGADLVKTTTGALVLGGTNTYSGATLVQAGVLQVNSETGLGNTTVSAGATLAGTGLVQGQAIINGSVGNLGLLKPGDSAGSGLGILTFNQNLTVANQAQVQLQIHEATLHDAGLMAAYSAGTEAYNAYVSDHIAGYKSATINPSAHDFLEIAGTLSLGTGTSGGVVRIEGDYVPVAGDVFRLMDWSGVMQGGFTLGGADFTPGGQVGDLYLPQLIDFSWDVTLFENSGILIVVPEPSRALLLLLAAGFLIGRRQGRQSV